MSTLARIGITGIICSQALLVAGSIKAESRIPPNTQAEHLIYECVYKRERSRQVGSITPHPEKDWEIDINYSFGGWRPWRSPEFNNGGEDALRTRIFIGSNGGRSYATFNHVWDAEGWKKSKLGDNIEPLRETAIKDDLVYATSGGSEYQFKNYTGRVQKLKDRLIVYEIDRLSGESTLTISMLMGTLIQEWQGHCKRIG